MSRTIKRKKNSFAKVSRYLPVFIILLSLTIIIGSTFAYFTDKVERTSELAFSKIELSSETTTGINGSLRDVIPGTPLVDGALKFSKSIDSEAIYVRAKISFSLLAEYKDDEDMKQILESLRMSTDFNIESEVQHGAVWSGKEGNYFYLMDAVNEGSPTNLKRVDTIDTYVLSSEVVVPRDLENLPNNAQYMKSINFHIAFEAIQADNVSAVKEETKEIFNTLFPSSDDELKQYSVMVMSKDGLSVDRTIKLEETQVLLEPEITLTKDNENTDLEMLEGWYLDRAYTQKAVFGEKINSNFKLYPKILDVSTNLQFTEIRQNNVVVAYSAGDGTCTDAEIVVPAIYKGKPVTETSSSGFSSNSNLISVILPNTITKIGYYCFYNSSNLGFIELPESITYIDNEAFRGCSNLELSKLPDNITEIRARTFFQCYKLALTSLPESIITIGESAFSNTKVVFTELPSSLITIGSSAFSSCSDLELAELPSGVTSIGGGAFSSCKKLKLTAFPSGITSIERMMFYGCEAIEEFTVPEGVTSIGESAFSGCKNMNYITLPQSLNIIGSSAFLGCTNLALTSLPDGLTSIGDSAFLSCVNLEINELPSQLTSIGSASFNNCGKLALTLLPDGITTIEQQAFMSCISLALTSLPSGIISIGSNAFSGCENLALTSLPDGITNIGSSAFYACKNIKSLKLTSNITTIENSAFGVTTFYLLCENETVAGLAKGKGNTNIFVLLEDSGVIDNYLFTDVTDGGDVVGSYSDTASGLTYLKVLNGDNVYSYYVTYVEN